MKGGAGAAAGVEGFVACGGFGLENLAIVCLEKILSTFLDSRVTQVENSKAAYAIDDVVGEMVSESC